MFTPEDVMALRRQTASGGTEVVGLSDDGELGRNQYGSDLVVAQADLHEMAHANATWSLERRLAPPRVRLSLR